MNIWGEKVIGMADIIREKYQGEDFEDKIKQLIGMQQEGGFWDFKREWHANNVDLLHDIICMSNNQEQEDGYIIIGVDENSNYAISDVSNDPNRKTTQNIVDFLRTKQFAGAIRPKVLVTTMYVESKQVDVLIVINDNHTPYYLVSPYQGVFANNIYTRIMDTNTPKTSSADPVHVEWLWRKRFGLLSSPIERVCTYLGDPNDWLPSPDESTMMEYYVYAPEYTIEHVDAERDGYEYYLFGQTDSRPHWYDINIRYHQTLIASIGGVGLDGARLFTATPLTDFVYFGSPFEHKNGVEYKYFIDNSLEYAIYCYFVFRSNDRFEAQMANRRYMESVLVFKTQHEKSTFEQFALANQSRYEEGVSDDELPYFPELDEYDMDYFRKGYSNALISQMLLVEMREQHIAIEE